MVQVYTGDGKGKTTAAFGLALRSVGAKKKIFIGQFVKGMKYSELNALKKLGSQVTVKQFGLSCFIRKTPTVKDIAKARCGFEEMKKILIKGSHDLVIMDEANIAVYYNLFSIDELIEAVKARAEWVEVVITGRKADKKLIKFADLVTEMREIKHYYTSGLQARVGIEK
ncbi:MAG: cob(I)yrinic acid a,c-diamide adenosyltransferase [Fibrobacteres bacterium]|nr:cob(I)yrinic acid a,c-diamide adenosyltransferase [Fibrobacterota bacterium]